MERWPERRRRRVRQLKLLRQWSNRPSFMRSNNCWWLTKREFRTCRSKGISRSGLMTRLFLVYRIGPNPCVRNPVFEQLERRPVRQTVGYFELPNTERAAHPIPDLHENHCFLLFAQMAH